jgi:predicted RNase H-like nuclease (RuvC/YqgF family)
MNYKQFALIIGIDPGVHTGISCWHKVEKRLLWVECHPAVEAEILVLKMAAEGRNILVRFEDAGSIKRDCQRWEEFLTHHNIPFEKVAPRNNRTKMTANAFKMLTGWQGKTNEHSRDSAALIIGL